MLSAPDHIKEIFARSKGELLGGVAQEFTRWHVGDDSIVVLDGEAHDHERRRMHFMLRGIATSDLTRDAVARALATWPGQGIVPLRTLLRNATLDATLACVFGALDATTAARLRHLVRAGAVGTSVSPLMHALPPLRLNLGRFSPGGRLRRVIDEFDQALVSGMMERPAPGTLLAAIAEQRTSPGQASDPLPTGQRLRALMGGLGNVPAAASWCAYHVFRDAATRDRVSEASNNPSPAATTYLDSVCRESLRLNPPFIGGFRHVAEPITLAGIAFRENTIVLPNVLLTHGRPDLYPEPETFRPERFMERTFASHEYAPFGGGERRCVAERFAFEQLRVILSELAATFEIRPAVEWSSTERRSGLLLEPREPLLALIRRRPTVRKQQLAS
jgi:cytochrome P450